MFVVIRIPDDTTILHVKAFTRGIFCLPIEAMQLNPQNCDLFDVVEVSNKFRMELKEQEHERSKTE